MWLMAQQGAAGNYILATGQGHTIKEFLECAAGILEVDWKKHVIVDANVIVKPPETKLIGDPTLAKTKLRWSHSVDFRELINIMVQCEISGGLD
jgi:GDPmannose 4,6-dehydratase